MKNVRIIKELGRITQQHGGVLRAEDVVEAARPRSSPLHSKFEWNDSKAAHEHRLWQARQLISVCVQVIPGANKEFSVYCSLSSDRSKRGGGYRTTVAVMSNAEMREQLLEDALHELNLFQRKYTSLRELAGVFTAIRKVRKKAA
jgi:hypothetical protein